MGLRPHAQAEGMTLHGLSCRHGCGTALARSIALRLSARLRLGRTALPHSFRPRYLSRIAALATTPASACRWTEPAPGVTEDGAPSVARMLVAGRRLSSNVPRYRTTDKITSVGKRKPLKAWAVFMSGAFRWDGSESVAPTRSQADDRATAPKTPVRTLAA